MSLKIFALISLACLATAKADEFNNEEETQETSNDGRQKIVLEDTNTQTSTALDTVANDDPDSIAHKGLCHWGIKVWHKPGFAIRCNCMKCTCQTGGNWACGYEFAYCPYFYCGNVIFNPARQICCCGKVYDKKGGHMCCGYFYYNRAVMQCCDYYSVKPKRAVCPRSKI